jgi:hypothetical protein
MFDFGARSGALHTDKRSSSQRTLKNGQRPITLSCLKVCNAGATDAKPPFNTDVAERLLTSHHPRELGKGLSRGYLQIIVAR